MKLGEVNWSQVTDWSAGWSVGEILCLKLLPKFLRDLNETCYT